jgi:chaperonin cofactor prefoldin
VNLPPGGGSWNAASSRAIKSNVVPVDTERVLEGVRGLEVSRWEYDAQEGVEHVGPMAGAFRDAFGLGADAAHIAGVDADGVALAAVQALADGRDATDERVDRLETATERGRDRVAALEARNQRTAARVATLEAENEALRERLRALEDRLDDAGSGRAPPGGAGE